MNRRTLTGGCSVRALSLMLFALCLCAAAPAVAQQPPSAGAPETFSARAQAENSAGAAVSAPILIHVERYTPDFDRATVEEALRVGGYPGFLPALRKAPDVGYVELGGRKFTIRWARQTPSDSGRTIVVVTDKPVAFIGGGPSQAACRLRGGGDPVESRRSRGRHRNDGGCRARQARRRDRRADR